MGDFFFVFSLRLSWLSRLFFWISPFSKQTLRSIFLENHVLRIGGAHRAPLFMDVSKQVLRSISFDEGVRA